MTKMHSASHRRLRETRQCPLPLVFGFGFRNGGGC